jgi:hypothetical protein
MVAMVKSGRRTFNRDPAISGTPAECLPHAPVQIDEQ